jgi:hypothetical protein
MKRLWLGLVLLAGLTGTGAALADATTVNNITVTPITRTSNLISLTIPNSGGLTVNVATGTAALPMQNINTNPNAVQTHLGDDGVTTVPLGFSFPFWNQTFTTSYMYANGLVSFTNGNLPGGGCCAGENLSTLRDTRYNYLIAPMWTDLNDASGNATWFLRSPSSMTYGWYNTHEYGTNNLSSFEVNINSAGALDVRFSGAFVSNSHTVTSGFTGDLSQGQYFQFYHGPGFGAPTGGASWSAISTGGSLCLSNPLSDSSCPGYAAAYYTQQCTISALYDSSCPGYAVAYQTQQCTSDPLFSTSCSGYAAAYHTQQCSINPLYDSSCDGYAVAYHDQQCSLNPLYATDCTGYAVAYHSQQCSLNPLYATDCPGYEVAYHSQQCSLTPLYASDCPGYAAAYLNQQCTADQLYSNQCPGYQKAYALKFVVPATSSTTASSSVTTTTSSRTTVTASVSSSGTVTVGPSATGNSTVDNVISTPSTTSATSVSPASPNSVVNSAPAVGAGPASVTGGAMTAQQQPGQNTGPAGGGSGGGKDSGPSGDQPSSGGGKDTGPSGGGGGEQPKSGGPAGGGQPSGGSKQASAKEKQEAKGKAAMAAAKGAKSLDQQKAAQAAVIASMGTVPGFDAYSNSIIRDAAFYKPYSIYKNQTTVDNKRNLRGLTGPSDARFNEMIDSQYKKEQENE